MAKATIQGLERLGALSDGVYAIVLTLLVLDLKPPETPGLADRGLIADLVAQAPAFAAYIISFVMVGVLWLRHHRLFRMVRRGDGRILILNLFHLLFVTLIPFASALVGRYFHDVTSVILFSACLGLAGLTLTPIAAAAARNPDWLADGVTPARVAERWWLRYLEGIAAAVAIMLAFVSVEAALAVWGAFLAGGVAVRLARAGSGR